MATYFQDVRPLRVTTPLGPDALLLVGLSGHEAISRLFHFRLDALAENGTPVPFEKLLGQRVVVELGQADQDVRHLAGICSRVAQAGRDATFTSYHLEIVPELWFLTRIAQSRIFQQLTVPEILAQVLKGLAVQFQLTGPYEPRDYCVQYRETDFNFASRLMEEEGIFYFFRHTAKGHTLIVADSPGSFPELPEPLLFDEEFSGGNRDEERIGGWEKAQELRSGKVTLWDHCFELPGKHLEAEKIIQDSVAAGQVTHKLKIGNMDKLELYDYPGEYAQRFDGVNPVGGDRPADVQKILTDNQRTVALRMQEEAVAGLVIRGSGNVRALTSGSNFELVGHFDADGTYLLTGVEHAARLPVGYRSGDPDPFHYSSSFTCIPTALPFRPRRATPRPFVQGTQTAVVVGPPGEEIFTDKYGRVKVQFPWDRQGKLDANSSCWVRVGTIWAGRQWGAIHIPRIGQEVIVAFEEGDPDQPIIVGSVYNAEQMPPFGLPDGKVISGIKSNSTKGGGGYNELVFDDTKGKELIREHGQYDKDSTIEHDLREHVLHDRSRDVTNNESIKIGVDQSETVGNNRTATVQKGDDKLTVETGHRIIAINTGDHRLTVKTGHRTVDINTGNDTHTIKTGNRQVDVNTGNDTLNVKTGKKTDTVQGPYEITVNSQYFKVVCGASQLVLNFSGLIEIKGNDISITGANDVKIKGMNIESAADVSNNTKGAMVLSEAKAMNVVKGGMVQLNP